MRLWNFLALTILLLSASVVNAQAIRLRGTVLDPSGAVIPEADVKISQGNRVVIEGKSDSTGNFSFELPAGEYRVETSAAAFRSHQQNVRVAPNMRSLSITLALATLNAVVDVGQPDDKVSLEDDAKLTSTTIAGDDIKNLPEDEDALMAQLQALAAGTGAAGSTASFLVDGFSNGRIPPRDQIQQIIIDTNVFSAEGTGGPRIQIITKPGTGPWSGNLNLNYNDAGLNAKNPLAESKPRKHQRQIVTSYGGPVIPGKLTLRFNARTLQIEQEGTAVRAVTPDGNVSTEVFSPTKNQFLNLTGQLFLTQNNTFNFAGSYNTNEFRNQGIGGFTLPERATNFKGHNWNFQLSERAIIKPTLISEVRYNMFHNQNSQLPVTEAVAINVLDAFNSGGAQNRTRRRGTNYNFGNTIRWTVKPSLNLQIGTDWTYNKNYSSSETNYLGVFTFSSLDDYLAGRPITFRQTTGDPVVNVSQLEFASFIQADWRVNPKVNLGAGVRYQAQTNLRDYNNLGPTFQIAYQPRNGTVLRAGGRLFYQVFNIGNSETVLRQDGSGGQVEIVILNPSYPNPFENGAGTSSTNNGSIRKLDPNLAAPYSVNSAVTLEQSLKKGWRFTVSYDVTRGVHQVRTRNINAPYPGTPLSDDLFNRLNFGMPLVQAAAREEVDRMRPLYPFAGNIYQFESAGESFSKNMGVRLYTPNNFAIAKIGINGFVQYTLGWARDNASAVNQYDWRSEWALSSFDARHRMIGNVSLRMPRTTTLSFLVTANSGRPYSLTTGLDNNGDQAINDRPAGIARNSLTGPGVYNVQMNFTKQFALRKPEGQQQTAGNNAGAPNPAAPQMIISGPGGPAVIGGQPATNTPGPKANFTVNVINLLNNTQNRGYSGVLTSPLFGKSTGAAQGRLIILGLNFTF
ncbi:MAG TPA: carboxypeptidase regulatory-like domain-containing protein [Terriglobia bacterium]|nr:carboxypeptidase regulatory-like domain-containing protein [Terriglobia bacterium]